MEEFKMGQKVACVATGFTGLITARCLSSSGMVQWGVTPRGPDPSVLPSTMLIDPPMLRIVDDGIAARIEQPDYNAPTGFAIGDAVRENYSKFEGIINEITWHLNGCVIANIVSPKISPLTGRPTEATSSIRNLTRLTASTTPPIKPVKTGGPARPLGRTA